MNGSLRFIGRTKETKHLVSYYRQRKHVLLVGPPGIGKTTLLRYVRHRCPFLHCEETSGLRRICDALERQLGWEHHKLRVVERKNRLLGYLKHRGELVVFDHVATTRPSVARFFGHLIERIPIWIACRSDQPEHIGHIWEYISKFVRIEIPPLTAAETRSLIGQAVAERKIQADAREHVRDLHRISKGNPGMLEELLIELVARKYRLNSSRGLNLLRLDREIGVIDLAIKATGQTGTR